MLPLLRKDHLSERLRTAVDLLKRTLRVGNYWYWLDVPELRNGVEISALVCPLRYDVLVRRDFFSFYSAHRETCFSDFQAFVDLVRRTSYYVWFMESEVVRSYSHLKGNAEALWGTFVERVRRAVALYESITAHGFDRRFPITLRTAEQLLPPTADRSAPPTGKSVSARYFQAVGCHRLAMLMYMGHKVLPVDCFRVQCFRQFSPFDSTSLLARSLPIESSSYFAFLSSYYCAPLVFEHKEEFLKFVAENRPEYLAEVMSVIRVDGF